MRCYAGFSGLLKMKPQLLRRNGEEECGSLNGVEVDTRDRRFRSWVVPAEFVDLNPILQLCTGKIFSFPGDDRRIGVEGPWMREPPVRYVDLILNRNPCRLSVGPVYNVLCHNLAC